jgi:hypothetical protein
VILIFPKKMPPKKDERRYAHSQRSDHIQGAVGRAWGKHHFHPISYPNCNRDETRRSKMLVAELNHSRKLGVEYEMTVPRVGSGNCGDVQSSIQQVLSSNGLTAVTRGYSQALLPPGVDLAVEHDSSVRGQSQWSGVTWFPIEIKTRILNLAEWEAIVPKTLEIAAYLGSRVNHTTGHHVHVGFEEIKADPRNLRSVYNLFLRYEPVIFGLVSPSRRTMG